MFVGRGHDPADQVALFSRFQSFLSLFFAKTGTFRNPESNRRSHDSALRSFTQLPDKRKFKHLTPGTNRAK